MTPDGVPGSYGSYLDKVHADDRARVGRVIETALTERRPWSLDYRIVRPDGELRMIHARGEVVVDENGRPSVVHGTCQDVTESHRVEDAAARRRAALPPRLRRRADRHGAHRPRRPLAAPEPLAVPDARAHRAAAAHDRAQRAQPPRGPPRSTAR